MPLCLKHRLLELTLDIFVTIVTEIIKTGDWAWGIGDWALGIG
ncbi:hypothetical protein [Nostoc sp.]